jgi:hypothetical protein
MDTAARTAHAGLMDVPDGPDGGEEELLGGGAHRSRRWAEGYLPSWLLVTRRVVIVVAALAVVVVGMRAVSQHKGASTPVAAPSRSAVVPAPPELAAATRPGPLDDVRILAETRGALTDYVRVDTPAGACPLVAVNHSPVGAVLRAERAQLGTVRLLDSRRTIDQATGLCDFAVRSRLLDVVITVSITPNATRGRALGFDRLETGADTSGGLTVEYGQMMSHDRWRVLVGAAARRQHNLPGSQQLLNLAQSRGMLW